MNEARRELFYRKGKTEGGTNINGGFKPDFTTHFFDQLFDNEEAQAGAGDTFGSFFFDSEEASEDFVLVFFGNSMALVFDVGDN